MEFLNFVVLMSEDVPGDCPKEVGKAVIVVPPVCLNSDAPAHS